MSNYEFRIGFDQTEMISLSNSIFPEKSIEFYVNTPDDLLNYKQKIPLKQALLLRNSACAILYPEGKIFL